MFVKHKTYYGISFVVHTADDNSSLLGPNFINILHSLRIDESNLLILTIFTVAVTELWDFVCKNTFQIISKSLLKESLIDELE